MASSSAKTKKKPTPTARAAKAPPAPTITAKEILFLEAQQRALPAVDDVTRSAFRSRFSDAHCDGLGTQTQSALVLNDVIVAIGVALRNLARPATSIAYASVRLAWLVECALTLHAARQDQQRQQGKVSAVVGELDKARQATLDARGELLTSLDQLAGEAEAPALDAARGVTTPDAALASSCEGLAKLGKDWLARATKDASAKVLVACAGLTQAMIEQLVAAGASFEAARAGKPAEGSKRGFDAPPVNRAEGRVLEELRTLMKALDAAHAKNSLVERWTPGAGTRRVLAPSSRPKKAAAAPPAATPPPN